MQGNQPLQKFYPVAPPALDLAPSCSDRLVQVRWSDLPLACPMQGTSLWNGHPRVYLPIHHTGREMCPWCGTVYMLQAPTPGEPTPDLRNLEIAKCYERALQNAELDALPGKTAVLTQDKA